MTDPTSRTLRLLSLLQTRRYWSGRELAGRMEVSLRTLRRDIDRLRELGYPVDAQRGVAGGYQLAAGASLPPLVLDDDEAVALAIGLMSAAMSPIEGMAESSVQVLAKLTQVMPKRLRSRVDALRAVTQPAWAGPEPRIEPTLLTTVAQACRDVERLQFGYAAADGTTTERTVEPHRLVPLGQRWYVVAYDLLRHEWRCFRLDRMGNSHRTGVTFVPRKLPAADAATYVRTRLQTSDRGHSVTALLDADADLVRSRIGRWATVEPLGSSSCRVQLHGASYEWAAMALAVTGAEFQVQGPPAFCDYLLEWAGRAARAANRT